MPRQNQRDVNFFSLCVQVIVRLSYLVDPTKSLAHPEELSTGLPGPLIFSLQTVISIEDSSLSDARDATFASSRFRMSADENNEGSSWINL
jgi:hypothetical protein